MESLTRREHWDAVHASERVEAATPRVRVGSHRFKRWFKGLLGPRFLEYMSSYDDHQIWEGIYRRYMPQPGASVVEIGSAPGEHLVKLSETFGLVPYGIEYSEEGVLVNRSLFAARGLDPDHVVALDFFSDECLSRYRDHFDVVVSRGFIEHFKDPGSVVDRHLELLKPGGLLVVTIPNLRGVNGALTRLFHPELIPMHNLEIMSKVPFFELFDTTKVRPLVCAYVGTFNFYLFNVKEGSRLLPLLRGCMKAQTLLNVAFRVFLGDLGAENRFTSPQLIFAGVKR
ncbi:MAG: methyltransferase domain-containing protein [Vicinamibacteria bacterium]|nr:methyltransferase domain-containing protein [Vicinamibacteria bacterium]